MRVAQQLLHEGSLPAEGNELLAIRFLDAINRRYETPEADIPEQQNQSLEIHVFYHTLRTHDNSVLPSLVRLRSSECMQLFPTLLSLPLVGADHDLHMQKDSQWFQLQP